MALYCVTMLNRWIRESSMVLLRWWFAEEERLAIIKACRVLLGITQSSIALGNETYSQFNHHDDIPSSFGIAESKFWSQVSLAWRNFSRNSASENSSIRRRYPTTCRHLGNWRSVRSCASNWWSIDNHAVSTSFTILCNRTVLLALHQFFIIYS